MGSERVMAVVVVGGGGGWWWGGGWWVVVVVGAAWGGCEVSAKHAPLVMFETALKYEVSRHNACSRGHEDTQIVGVSLVFFGGAPSARA